MDGEFDLRPLLEYINPSALSYQEWCNVGMALKHEGYLWSDWDQWSRLDSSRYHAGECEKKWRTFGDHGDTIVTGATITQMAKEGGWTPATGGRSLDWDDEIAFDVKVVNHDWLEKKELPPPPPDWDGAKDLTRYLETLFDSTDIVGYVTESWERDGKHFPTKGHWNYTAGEIIDQLNRHHGDLGAVLGDYDSAVGAWIRFNPLDGQGCGNENVRGYRFALVESDANDLDTQYSLIRELELPVACLVHSGKKSLHAIVRVDADTYDEYRKRVDYLYTVCEKNGLTVDKQNRNPSRLSRMPGVMRDGKPQYLIATDMGKASWAEWKDWIEGQNDDLPDTEALSDVWDTMPDLAPPLISGVLRKGHKLLLAGPSKAGKSYALIELCCAIAEGRPWMGFPCAAGRVLYVNLELDRASCLHRFRDVYTTMGWSADHLDRIDIWNLRGRSMPLDKLAPRLIRRAQKSAYIAVVIDPIYKIITGDENSADQMAKFCNHFDTICAELGCAVIYCHHHSKGAQGGKRSMDRASGSGVFGRDPDALLDLIELPVSEDMRTQAVNRAVGGICEEELTRAGKLDQVSQDDLCAEVNALTACERVLSTSDYSRLVSRVTAVKKEVEAQTAWRIEGTLREFPRFPPVNIWFRYPRHLLDKSGVLVDVEPEQPEKNWKKNFSKKRSPEEVKKDRLKNISDAFDACNIDGEVTVKDLSTFLGTSEKTVRGHLKEHGGFWVEDGKVGRKAT